jgi:hypothetical protein
MRLERRTSATKAEEAAENSMKGTGSQAAENSCFVSGHDFGRAVNARLMMALAAEVRLFNAVSATKNRVISV